MTEKYALLLIDENELIFQIVQISHQYKNYSVPEKITLTLGPIDSYPQPEQVILAYASIASSDLALGVLDWKVCSRHLPARASKLISLATNLKIEPLTHTREQELLCLGLGAEI
jgi:hypothetical protein